MAFPLSDLRRPPLRRFLDGAGARWRAVDGSSIAVETEGAAEAHELALVDLSALPRIGFKGRGTVDAMRRRGLVLEPEANRAFAQSDGTLCLVLAPSEVILLSGLSGEARRFAEWETGFRIEDEERTYPLLRRDSHFWLAISGRRAPEMFAKLCAIDLRALKFQNLSIAQTSVAKMSAIVVRWDIGLTPVFHVLADAASASYFSTCLLDASREFGGKLVGLAGLDALGAHQPEIGKPSEEGQHG